MPDHGADAAVVRRVSDSAEPADDAEKITPENAWREYPRPQLVRQNWQNLNGLWQYAVNERKADRPDEWAGEILVPFAIETPLSGVKRLLEPSEQLWYRRVFNVAFNAAKERVLLHFGGVDFRMKAATCRSRWTSRISSSRAKTNSSCRFGIRRTPASSPAASRSSGPAVACTPA